MSLHTNSKSVNTSMRGNKSKHTKPELLLRKALWASGLRGYRLHFKKLAGSPDIVFSTKKIAIFVNGCFWHRCPKCNLNLPKTNTEFWKDKFDTNMKRDQNNYVKLIRSNWTVLTIRECDIKKNLKEQVLKIESLIKDVNAFSITTNEPLQLAAEDLLTYGYNI
ncbi:very short patch repair endonuclease [Croceibacter atlanticus]|uniref:very short patch repair endonuclease n=1 Tax=Croceibacter atlanticus TaxID=313588 RepID=UPI001C5DAAA3|nr:very short patch repair endonuclease [Croceibacter atlanticus]MBW4970203.1 very short patch repair endonuclease [Croceibacter atlanticus]